MGEVSQEECSGVVWDQDLHEGTTCCGYNLGLLMLTHTHRHTCTYTSMYKLRQLHPATDVSDWIVVWVPIPRVPHSQFSGS